MVQHYSPKTFLRHTSNDLLRACFTRDEALTEIAWEDIPRDQTLEYIQRKFAGHKLTDLLDAVLQAEGYLTRVSPPGPDGGVDILVGSGPMRFGEPRLCVQVKASPSPADVNAWVNCDG